MNYERFTKAELIKILKSRDPVIPDSKGGVNSSSDHLSGRTIAYSLSSDSILHLLDEFPALVWRSGLDAKCNFFNLNWLEFTGRSMEQEIGDGWAEGVHPDDLQGCISSYLSAFHARRPFELEYRLKRHDGEYRWIFDLGCLLHTPAGEFAGYVGWCFDITKQKAAEEELLSNQEQLKVLAEELFQAEERERRRIAGDLHDMLGHNLILAKIHLKSLEAEMHGHSALSLVDDTLKLIDESVNQVRSLTFQLSPPLLYEVGLEAAVESMGERIFEKHGLDVCVRKRYDSLVIREELRVTLYQVVRELLMNVVKHVSARKVFIIFDKSDSLTITLEDDGIGFNVDELITGKKGSKGFGLFNVRQKIERTGGSFKIESSIGRGTRVVLNVPL